MSQCMDYFAKNKTNGFTDCTLSHLLLVTTTITRRHVITLNGQHCYNKLIKVLVSIFSDPSQGHRHIKVSMCKSDEEFVQLA